MRGRYYDPQIARFIARDPAGLAGGINLYAYAGDDPVDSSDPTGTDGEDVPSYPSPYPGDINQSPADTIGAVGAFVYQSLPVLANRNGHDIMEGRQTSDGIQVAQEQIPLPKVGDRLHRLYDGIKSPQLGRSWTTKDPRTMTNPRKELSLPDDNTATRMVTGTLKNTEGVTTRPALSDGNNPGGAPETVVPNPAGQIDIEEDIPFEIPFEF